MDFGSQSRKLREQAGLTQEQVAYQVGVTKSMISYYELRERAPSASVLVKYAQIFHVSTDYLLGLEKHRRIDVNDLNEQEIAALETVAEAFRSNK